MTSATMRIDAREIIGSGFPPEEGTFLADQMLKLPTWDNVIVDLRKCAPGLLISAFFNGFLQRVADKSPSRLAAARKVEWQLAHEFQRDNVAKWMKNFKPDAGPDAGRTVASR